MDTLARVCDGNDIYISPISSSGQALEIIVDNRLYNYYPKTQEEQEQIILNRINTYDLTNKRFLIEDGMGFTHLIIIQLLSNFIAKKIPKIPILKFRLTHRGVVIV